MRVLVVQQSNLFGADRSGLGTSHQFGESGLRLIPPDLLISPEYQYFSTQQVVGKDRVLEIYLQRSAGSVQVNGGDYGIQTIQVLPIRRSFVNFFKKAIGRLDRKVNLDFQFVPTAEKADVRFYSDSEISLGGTGGVLGTALNNLTPKKNFWEIMINTPAFGGDVNYYYFAALHEFGHALGLEHPFDASDGDVFESVDSSLSAYPEETLMAYRSPQGGVWPTGFSSNDLAALQAIWGDEPKPKSSRRLGSQRLIAAKLKDELTGLEERSAMRVDHGGDLVTGESNCEFYERKRSNQDVGANVINALGRQGQTNIHDGLSDCLSVSSISMSCTPRSQREEIGISDFSLGKLQDFSVGLPANHSGDLG